MPRRFAQPSAIILCLIVLCSRTLPAAPPSPHVVADPPLSPAEQIKKFHLPPGFEIQLVAAEPEIKKPINIAFDAAGRLYATGSVEYPFPAADPAKARDTVQRFTIGVDGRATKTETVVTGLNIPIGVSPYNDELFVFSIPHVLRCRDRDGDGVFEDKQPILKGFGFKDTHGLVNNITPWIDGWIYCCHGFSNDSEVTGVDGSKIAMQSGNTFRFRPDGSHVEYFTHGQVNPFGLAFDPLGNLYSADCHTLPAYQLIRGAWYPSFGKPHDGLGYGPPMMKHQHGSTGIAGIVYYAATQFPAEYRDTLFIGNPITNRVNHDKLQWHGSTPEAIEQPDFISCDDRWFRPVDLKLGPDGALYIADFYNRIIGHYEVPLDHPERDRERGRIWRVVYKGQDKKDVPPPVDLTKLNVDGLIEKLGDENLAMRVLATNWLAARDHRKLVSVFDNLMTKGGNPWQRVHALWLMERMVGGMAEEPHVIHNSERVVRLHALKTLAERSADKIRVETPDTVGSRILRLEKDAVLARAAADLLGRHHHPENWMHLSITWKSTPADDTHLTHALRIALRNNLQDHKLHNALSPQRDAETVFRSLGKNEDLMAMFVDVSLGDPSPESAAFIQRFIGRPKVVGSLLAPCVEHVIRYIPASELTDFLESIGEFQFSTIDRQVAVLRSINRALPTRGVSMPDYAMQWQRRVVGLLLKSDQESQVQAGLDLAREVKLPELFDVLQPAALSNATFANLRPAAIDACVACDAARAIDLCGQILGTASEPINIRQKSAQALGSLNQGAARQVLVEQLKAAPERLAVEIAVALGGAAPGAEALLDAVQSGKASGWLLQDQAILRSLSRSKLPQLNERIAKLTAGLPPRDDRLAKLVETRRAGFGTHAANVDAGQAVYKKICANCHRIAGQGQKIGPELDGIGLRGLDRLLEDVLDPSRTVDQAFRATIITTRDGRTLIGLAQRREGEVQLLIDAQGKEQRVPVTEIDEQIVSSLSPMPANVADLLKESEFYDLLAFLLAQRVAGAPTSGSQ